MSHQMIVGVRVKLRFDFIIQKIVDVIRLLDKSNDW